MVNRIKSVLIGNSPELQNAINTIRLVSKTDVTVLISGESGTGKELLAKAIHHYSPRIANPFVTINCASLSKQQAEGEIFGYMPGEGCTSSCHQGRIAQANHGTLFLDEIAELPYEIQGKLLRFLETGEYQPVGSSQTHSVKTRVVVATNADLQAMVEQGRFREDLFYRLNIVPVHVPPLRERGGDIELLTRNFLHFFAQQYKKDKPGLHAATVKALNKYHWPGNVRQLRNLCERMVILQPGQEITPEKLPPEICSGPPQQTQEVLGFAIPETGIRLFDWEKRIISQALNKTNGNRTKAAKLLGLSRDTLLYRIKKYALA